MVVHDVLQPDSELPSVRQMAAELSINPNTIQRAYSELESRGVIYSVKGKGNFVSTKRCGTARTSNGGDSNTAVASVADSERNREDGLRS